LFLSIPVVLNIAYPKVPDFGTVLMSSKFPSLSQMPHHAARKVKATGYVVNQQNAPNCTLEFIARW
jgi:hypothetical protein